jgi:hypothetical protein
MFEDSKFSNDFEFKSPHKSIDDKQWYLLFFFANEE